MRDQGKIIVALLAGAAVGAAVALLLAPASGSELREEISDYVNDLTGSVRNKAELAANSLREYGTNAIERSKSKFKDSVNELESLKDDLVNKAKNKSHQLAEPGLEASDKLKSRIKAGSNDLNDLIQNA